MSEQLRSVVRLLSLPQTASLDAAHRTDIAHHRELVVVELHDPERGISGWGECGALNRPGYTTEWARGCFERLAAGQPIDRTAHPMAAAALQMARLDLALRADHRSLSDHLGFPSRRVPAGATIGLGSTESVLRRADRLAAIGYRRIKLKIAPDHDLRIVQVVQTRHPDVELHLDANGSFPGDAVERLATLSGVSVIEQPFEVDDHAAAAALRSETEAKVLLDEGGRPRERLEAAIDAGALDGVVVKPGCVGGITSAVELLDDLHERGIPASIGGMVESALGRRVLTTLASHPAASITGDLSPSALWLAEDPWPDLAMSEGAVAPYDGAGVAPVPDQAALDRVTVAIRTSQVPR